MIDLNKKIIDMYPMKAQFERNKEIAVGIEFNNDENRDIELKLELKVLHLNKIVDLKEIIVDLKRKDNKKLEISINPKDVDFKGYGADAYLYEKGKLIQVFSTSFDVVSSYKKATRYGFLSDFYNVDRGDIKDIENISKLHINLVQFYDWMYRHDELVPKSNSFINPMGRTLDLEIIKEKIEYCHRFGIEAVAYGAVYAASRSFYKKHKNWALRDSKNEAIKFIDLFYIMNISKDCPWHFHIIDQYKKAISEVGFDGIHMDTYGFPKTALSKVGDKERVENLEEDFPILINNTKKALKKFKKEVCIIFNNVGNWPIESVASTDIDSVYIEVWEPYERYHHLKELIKWGKYLSKDKPVILAAYLKQYIGIKKSDIDKAHISLLIITAIITSNGGYHMLLGEENGILTRGYYVDYYKVKNDFFRVIRNYYDFIVRYSNIFFNPNLRDVSMTHMCGDNLEYTFKNIEFTAYGEPGKVWTIARENKRYKTITFINLTNNSEDFWNKSKNKPELKRNIVANVQIERKVKKVFYASPDFEMGRPIEIDYKILRSKKGKILKIRIPKLHIWSILIIKFEING